VELRLSTAEKFRLKPLPEFTGFPEPEDPQFPLLVISAKGRYYLWSSYRWLGKLREKRPHPPAEIHPDTAAMYGIGQHFFSCLLGSIWVILQQKKSDVAVGRGRPSLALFYNPL
jgi:hypothetical protein